MASLGLGRNSWHVRSLLFYPQPHSYKYKVTRPSKSVKRVENLTLEQNGPSREVLNGVLWPWEALMAC